ncbi:MAG: peptidoglycan DD-metalloendopeptidase family protein [Bacteroidaceae bacterium]|jgi:murein DD-endopeptidase MepM/ murein hydrolase activator NlpD|nr:peptidoglycan DD-metalloendopeptidase family protein [Bacteroidaceae bacterium]
MMIKYRNLFKTAFFVFAALTASSASAQDLLARQAPVDRKMKAVDSIVLNRLIEQEMFENPAGDIYDEWDNELTHYSGSPLPDETTVDLRGFCMPTTSRVVTSNFGARWGRQHKGIDVKVYIGDTIRAAFSGKVRIVKYEPRGYGKYVVIRHYNGLETYYGHMSKQLVTENEEVKAGDPIGLGGNTGRSTGSHLHFETRLCGVALNPALMFDFRNQDVTSDFYTFRRSRYASESAMANRLRGANSSSRGNGRFEGDSDDDSELAIAAPSVSFAPETHFHKVKKGETLQAVARKCHTTVEALCKLNRIGKNIRLMPGQILKYN